MRIYIYIGALIPRVYIGTLATRPHLGATRPRVGIAKLGSMPQLGNKKMYCICLSRHRALTSKCRRGDEAAEKSHDVGRRYRCNICVSH